MTDKRSGQRTIRCNWCFNIICDGHWIAERRKRGAGDYRDVVCRKCKVYFFGDHDIVRTIKEIKDWQA